MFLICLSCTAQQTDYTIVLEQLEQENQEKLDIGKQMMQTERDHLIRLDSLMNIVYQDLLRYKNTNKKAMKIEQEKWVVRNNVDNKETWQPITQSIKNGWVIGDDMKMIAYSKQADLKYNRILELIGKFED